MNFSRRTKLVKLFSLLAVLILMSALFTGCKKDEEPAAASTEPELNLNLNLTPTESTEAETEPSVPETTAPVISEKSATVVSQLNIRSAPSTNGSSVIGTLYAGDKVTVERREEVSGIQWAYISEPSTGWICMDFVEMDIPDAVNNNTSTPAGGENSGTPTEPENDEPGTSTNIKGVVTANGGLMIRDEASTNGEVKGIYEKGQVVTITETKNGWGRTNKGWIKMQYVNTTGSTTNNNTANNNTNVSGNGSTTVQMKGIVKVNELNIRDSASTAGTRLGSYTYGARVEILEKSGSWGRTEKGWISLDYVYQDGTTGTKTATGKVTANGLNLRGGPGTGYDVVGGVANGQTVNILEQFTYNGTTWGCTKNGWVCMDYIDTGDNNTTNNNTNNNNNDEAKTGTITGSNVNIRSGPGTGYASIGSYDKGDEVTILSTTTAGGITWGKTHQGYVSMDYVDLD